MKKLIFLVCICLIFLGGCTIDYKDIKPKKPMNGTIAIIDSTQWRTVLIQEGDQRIFIVESSGEIREIPLVHEKEHTLVVILIALCISLFIIALSTSRY